MLSFISKKITSALLIFLLALFVASQIDRQATKAAVETKITASDAAGNDQYGYAIDVSGDYAIVGAWINDTAYILKNTAGTWSELIKITGLDTVSGDRFGYDAAIDGDYAIVGAYWDDDSGTNSGSAYIFYKNQGGADNWGQVKKLTASDAAGDDRFGSVDISGNVAIVGAKYNDDAGSNSGSAYIYYKDQGGAGNWGEVKKLTASDAAGGDQFGMRVSIAGNYAVATAGYGNAAYVFEKDHGGADNWGERKILTPDSGGFFGIGADSYGTDVAIGAMTEGTGGTAYIFSKDQGGADNWGKVKTITPNDVAASDQFGRSVGLYSDYLVVGAGNADSGAGAAYVFRRNTGGADNWGQSAKYKASDAAGSDNFGWVSAISADYAFIGAPYDDDNGSESGSVYIYSDLFIPNTPSNFYSSAFDGLAGTATLNWTDNATNEDNFNIYYSTTGIQPGVPSYTPAADATSQAATGLSSIRSNYFWLTAENADGESSTVTMCLKYSSVTGKILPCDGVADDYFGASVFISSDYAIIGANGDDDNGSSSGSAYIFYKDQGGVGNWGQVTKITASDGAATDSFGYSVSISGDYAIVGAFQDDSSQGSAYIFYKDQGGANKWGEVKKLTASDGAASDAFGASVAINGNYAIVGARYDDGKGAAYIFEKDYGGADNWGERTKITASDGAAGDQFGGHYVSISGDYAAIGAQYDDDSGSASGSAYIYNRNQGGADNWGEVTKIIASDGAAGDNFGASVSISGDHIVVGASYGDGNEVDSGSAYIFYKDQGGVGNWGQVTKIIASDGLGNDTFGASVSISGDSVVIGAYFDDDNGNNSGSSYIYSRNQGGADNWGEIAKLTASDGAAIDLFGESVSISGDYMVVGAYGDDDNGSSSGSAYMFTLPVCGNGAVEGYEECDDGNNTDGDGCSSTCTIEAVGRKRPISLAPPCTPAPVKLNIGQTAVSQSAGKTIVTLQWSGSGFEGGGTGILKAVRKVYSGGTYISDKTFEINPNLRSWKDMEIPASETQKTYKYQLVTESCGQTKYGNEVEVTINPRVPAGTSVDVTLNLKIKIKEAYDILMMNRLRELFEQEQVGIPAYIRSCEEVRAELFGGSGSGVALEYIITCFGEDDEQLIREIILQKELIIPPLMAMLKGLDGEITQQTIESYLRSKIKEMKAQMTLRESIKSDIQNEGLNVGGFIDVTNITDLSETDEEVIQQIDESYFTGVSHAANLLIEKYDSEENLLETFETRTDIFGMATIGIGEFIAGDDYIIKIKLADEKFVLPKVVTLQINNAVKIGDDYVTDIDLIFDRHFRYGDFNEDGEINLLDIGAWGNLLRGKFEDGYELWQLWQFANLDGFIGINLLDIITLQENWGGAEE